ncbi:hypothetical protein RS85_03387 [Microbacterium sp. SA39]|nr:hypothetical protein RS85_03387 [Microbacterium sp. SA39]
MIDGASNRLIATLSRFISRRGTATLMHRLTDPARREREDPVIAYTN